MRFHVLIFSHVLFPRYFYSNRCILFTQLTVNLDIAIVQFLIRL